MNININNLPLPVTSKLTEIIKEALKGKDLTGKTSATINFRDPDYSAENGGYHPVEIMLKRHGDEWHFQYITDFCYVGIGPFAELVKDLDFDFRLKINASAWLHNCEGLEKTYYRVIGSSARLQEFCKKLKQQRVLGITAARQAFG